jgi:hypothetical protein
VRPCAAVHRWMNPVISVDDVEYVKDVGVRVAAPGAWLAQVLTSSSNDACVSLTKSSGSSTAAGSMVKPTVQVPS